MTSFSKVAVGGLLWLSFSAAAFGTNIYFTGQPDNVNGGGEFTAYLSSNPSQTLYTYCVDDLNSIGTITMPPTGFSVNIVDLANATQVAADTRYGQTAPASFTNTVNVADPPPVNNTTDATAQDRYAMAAWLIEQYSFPVTSTTDLTDDYIQNAIWSLLDATGKVFNNCDFVNQSTCATGVSSEIAAATTWINGQIKNGTLTAFESNVVIYSSTAINPNNTATGLADPARYYVGDQEMIGFVTTTPEPATLAMLGAGLIAIGLFRKRVKA